MAGPGQGGAGFGRRTPPAIFPPVMGLFGLGLAWRTAEEALGLASLLGEAILGAVSILFLFALAAWLAKPLRRAAVAVEELRVLPGRAGLAALTLSVMLLAATLVPYAPRLALLILLLGLSAHALVVLLAVRVMFTGPDEARTVTPVWHLLFVGFIIAGLAAVPLGLTWLAYAVLYATMPLAALIWAAGGWQVLQGRVPVPLRPLLAIHLAPACLFSVVAGLLDLSGLAFGFAMLALVMLLGLLTSGRWVMAGGFTPLWGAFTFPLAAVASSVFALVPASGGAMTALAAGALALATLAIPPIAFAIFRAWSSGRLAEQTNAAEP